MMKMRTALTYSLLGPIERRICYGLTLIGVLSGAVTTLVVIVTLYQTATDGVTDWARTALVVGAIGIMLGSFGNTFFALRHVNRRSRRQIAAIQADWAGYLERHDARVRRIGELRQRLHDARRSGSHTRVTHVSIIVINELEKIREESATDRIAQTDRSNR